MKVLIYKLGASETKVALFFLEMELQHIANTKNKMINNFVLNINLRTYNEDNV